MLIYSVFIIRAARTGLSLRILAKAFIVSHSSSEARRERIRLSVPSGADGLRPAPSRFPPHPFLLLLTYSPPNIVRTMQPSMRFPKLSLLFFA